MAWACWRLVRISLASSGLRSPHQRLWLWSNFLFLASYRLRGSVTKQRGCLVFSIGAEDRSPGPICHELSSVFLAFSPQSPFLAWSSTLAVVTGL